MNASLLTDGYKLDHRRQYPVGTEYVYANWTPRSNGYMPDAKDGAVVFGIQLDGIKKVAQAYDHVFITNSYKEWGAESELPDNVTVFKVFR